MAQGSLRRRLSLTAALTLVPVHAAAEPESEPAPRDPNELPQMDAPYGQPRLDGRRRFPSRFTGKFHQRRRFQLTAEPLYSALRVQFLGRPAEPIRGGGAALNFDVEIWRPFWFRVLVAYSAHPVEDQYSGGEEEAPVLGARGGVIQTAHASAGAAYALDFGRMIPILELGLGGLWIMTPEGVVEGQLGQQCLGGSVCDTGLVCGTDNVCRQGALFSVNIGAAFDVRVTEHFVAGVGIRYFAFASNPGALPVYLHGTLRLGVRW